MIQRKGKEKWNKYLEDKRFTNKKWQRYGKLKRRKCWWVIVCQIHRRIPQSRVASLFSIIQHERRSASAFQLFIVGSKQFFRSFYPFLLYLTFSILKIEILSARVGTNKYQACKLLIRYLLEVNRQSARSLKEEAKHLLNARNPLKKNGNTR